MYPRASARVTRVTRAVTCDVAEKNEGPGSATRRSLIKGRRWNRENARKPDIERVYAFLSRYSRVVVSPQAEDDKLNSRNSTSSRFYLSARTRATRQHSPLINAASLHFFPLSYSSFLSFSLAFFYTIASRSEEEQSDTARRQRNSKRVKLSVEPESYEKYSLPDFLPLGAEPVATRSDKDAV